MHTDICPICGLEASIYDGSDALDVECNRCGRFRIVKTALSKVETIRTQGFKPESEHHIDWQLLQFLPAYTRQQSERGEKATLSSTNWRDYARRHINTPEEQKLFMLLYLVKERARIPGHMASLNCNLDYPLVDAASLEECKDLLDDLKNKDFLKYTWHTNASYNVTILPSGRRYLEQVS